MATSLDQQLAALNALIANIKTEAAPAPKPAAKKTTRTKKPAPTRKPAPAATEGPLTLSQKPLNAVLRTLKKVIGRSPRPSLRGVRVDDFGDRIEFTATNLEVSATMLLPRASGRLTNSLILPIDPFINAVPNREGEVTIEWAPSKSGQPMATVGAITMPAVPQDDWPNIKFPERGDWSIILTEDDSARLITGLERVLPATSDDQGRPLLQAVAFDAPDDDHELTLVATDSYRLHTYDTGIPYKEADLNRDKGGRPIPWTVPALAGRLLANVCGRIERMTFRNGLYGFDGTDGRVYGRIVEGTFPNWRQLVPTATNTVTITIEHLRESLTTLDPLLKAAGKQKALIFHTGTPLDVTVGVGAVKASSQKRSKVRNMPEGTVTAGVQLLYGSLTDPEGMLGDQDGRVAYNTSYFTDLIRAGRTIAQTEGDTATLVCENHLKPVRCRIASDDRYWGLLMPVRI